MTQQNKSECSNCGRGGDELGGVVCRECSGLDEAQDELATLQRQHEQLRAAAERVNELLGSRYEVLVSRIEIAQILRAALDAPAAEPETDPVSKQVRAQKLPLNSTDLDQEDP